MDIIKNTVVFFTILHINGVLGAIISGTFSVSEGTVPNLAGTEGITVRNGSEVEFRCTYNTVPTPGEVAAHEFHSNANVQPSPYFFRYVHPPIDVPPGQANPVIEAPFKSPIRVVRRDGTNFGGIRVNPILLSDENIYKCKVILVAHESFPSPIVIINVVAIPHFPTLSGPIGGIVAGNQLTLTCSANVGKPKGELKWLRQLRTESSPVVVQKNKTESETENGDGSFQVSELYTVDIVPDTYDGAKFFCEARNAALTSSEGSPNAEMTLNVRYPVRDIKVTPIDQPHYPGQQFKCEAVGNPTPSYQWTKMNGSQTLTTSGSTLTIPDTATPESLFYKCAASNTPGSSEVQISYTLNVNITAAPTTMPPTTEKPTPTTPTQQTPKPPGPATGAKVDARMIGGIVGALIAIIIIIIIVICVCRNKKKKEVENVEKGEKFKNEPNNANNIPMGGYDVDVDDNFNPAEDPKKKNLEGLVYADLNFDDRPRSRKPIQIQEEFDHSNYADIRRV
ncbi:hemicentin-1-like isoform X2 [Lineus longissimus]|uniref:hemicentin-1-like isoform X2 n=1 Tax=Lineus longissimus TaxID=88925 RepID=UPI002B4CDF4B